MREKQIIEYRGFGLGHVLVAALTGAAAGAAVAYLTAPENRQRLREAMDGTRANVARMPLALRRATEAARDAFNGALEESAG